MYVGQQQPIPILFPGATQAPPVQYPNQSGGNPIVMSDTHQYPQQMRPGGPSQPILITSVVSSFKDLMSRKKYQPPLIEVVESKV